MPSDLATRPALPGQTTADPDLVAEAVTDINAAYDRGGLHTMRAIAAIVLDKMFRDDVGSNRVPRWNDDRTPDRKAFGARIQPWRTRPAPILHSARL